MRRTCFLSLLAVVILSSACASSGEPGESRPRRSRNLITANELSGLSVASAYEAVRTLRPNWLRPHGRAGLPMIYRDGTRWGETRSLQRIQIGIIREMRFLSASDANTRYGTGGRGVILVVTK